jgi:hypothetical protein
MNATFRVVITDHVTQAVVDSAVPRSYTSPAQSEQQARSLIGVLLGAAGLQGPGPWTHAVAGGRRVIELDEVHQ